MVRRKDTWASRFGVIMAVSGSAIGLWEEIHHGADIAIPRKEAGLRSRE